MIDDLSLKDKFIPPPTLWRDEATELKELNLDKELLTNYQAAKNYLEDIKFDEKSSASQVAQVMNTITSILKEIVKMQTDLYDAERVKHMEAALIETMKAQPEDVQRMFFEAYEQNLAR